MTKQQAVCATVSKTPPNITAANSDVRRKLAARCAGCPDPARARQSMAQMRRGAERSHLVAGQFEVSG
jgi:hypothetical protein